MLKKHRIKTAIVSITWEFAVEWFARKLGADYYVGTKYLDGHIKHFWPEDKPRWVSDLVAWLNFKLSNTAAVGDSTSDLPMLQAVGYPFFVGITKPAGFDSLPHFPDGNVREITEQIISK